MTFTEDEIIKAFKSFANPNNGWIYLDGVPESNAKLIIDYMKEHKEPIDEEKLDELAHRYCQDYYLQSHGNGYANPIDTYKAGYRKAIEE